MRIVYLLEEDLSKSFSKKRETNLLSDTYLIETEESFYHIPENARLLGALPAKELLAYNSEREFFLEEERGKKLQEEIAHYAWGRLLKYLGYRERSIAECQKYLKALPLGEDLAKILIKKALDMKYLDEKRFAELLTQSFISRRKSKRELKSGLIAKRIDPDLIDKVMKKNYTEEEQKEILQYQIDKGIRKYPDKNSYKDLQKCIAYLIRKGFSYGDFRDQLLQYYRNTEETDI